MQLSNSKYCHNSMLKIPSLPQSMKHLFSHKDNEQNMERSTKDRATTATHFFLARGVSRFLLFASKHLNLHTRVFVWYLYLSVIKNKIYIRNIRSRIFLSNSCLKRCFSELWPKVSNVTLALRTCCLVFLDWASTGKCDMKTTTSPNGHRST